MRVPLLLAAALCTAFAACSPTPYVIGTREGGSIITSGKPELDEAAGVYTYTDANGRTSTVRRDDVLLIAPR